MNTAEQALLINGRDFIDRTRDVQPCSWEIFLNNLGQDQTVSVAFKKLSIPNLFNNITERNNILKFQLFTLNEIRQYTIVIPPQRYSLQTLGDKIVELMNAAISNWEGVVIFPYNENSPGWNPETDVDFLQAGHFALSVSHFDPLGGVNVTIFSGDNGSTIWNSIGHSLSINYSRDYGGLTLNNIVMVNAPQLNNLNMMLLTAGRLTPGTAIGTDQNYYNLLTSVNVGSTPYGSLIYNETPIRYPIHYFHSRHVSSFEIALRDTQGNVLNLDQASAANIYIELVLSQINSS